MNGPEILQLAGDDRFPNSILPLLVYRKAVPADAAAIERSFAAQGWGHAWRSGVFDFHHFHSNSHEVLGIVAGTVEIAFGGPTGRSVAVQAGDVVVIPAGVAHRNIGQSADLLVVGAYPGGDDYDTLRGDPAHREAAEHAVSEVKMPDCDPVLGRDGGLRVFWVDAMRQEGAA